MILKINCPSCNKNIIINFNYIDDSNNEIISVEIDEHIETSQDIIMSILSDMGVEFG